MTPAPLRGRRVLDLSQYIAGPVCGQLLADFGAEVIKIEPPSGDPSRALGSTAHGSVYFRQYNTGKTSLIVDLRDPVGRARLDAMLADSDAIVLNFSSSAMLKLGLDWPSLHARHPHLVAVVISAYGIADSRTAFDSIVQAASGFAQINADEAGEPRISAGYPTDVFSGMYGAMAAAMALLDPQSGGVLIDVPMIEVAMSALGGASMLAVADGDSPRPGAGNRDIATAPSNTFSCSDGHAYVYAGLDKHWERLQPVVGGPVAPLSERLMDPVPFEAAVALWTSQRTVADVCEVVTSLGIAAGPVARPDDALRELHDHRPDAVIDQSGIPQLPVTFSGERVSRSPAPPIGREATHD